jgi:hypothetical protein
LRNHPASFIKDLGRLPDDTKTSERLSGMANVIVYFTDKKAALEKDFAGLSSALVSRRHAVDRLAEEGERQAY